MSINEEIDDESRTNGGGATLLINELLDSKKILERSEEMDATDSKRVRLEDSDDSSGNTANRTRSSATSTSCSSPELDSV